MLRPLLSWIFGPHIFELVAFFLAGVGLALALSTSKANMQLAHWFFGASFLMLFGRAIHWLVTTSNITYPRPVVAALLFAMIGGGWMVVYQWVEKQIHELFPTSATTEEQKSFSVEHGMAVVSSVKDGSQLWILHGGGVISPIHLAVCITVTNLKTTPAMISQLFVEAQKANSEWVSMIRIPDGIGQIYWTTDLVNVSTPQFGDPPLLPQISNRSFGPGESARGWLFLAAPSEYEAIPKPPQFRVRIIDTTRIETTKVLAKDESTLGGVGTFSIHLSPANVNLSGYQKSPYK